MYSSAFLFLSASIFVFFRLNCLFIRLNICILPPLLYSFASIFVFSRLYCKLIILKICISPPFLFLSASKLILFRFICILTKVPCVARRGNFFWNLKKILFLKNNVNLFSLCSHIIRPNISLFGWYYNINTKVYIYMSEENYYIE